jgi:hypothetical protein
LEFENIVLMALLMPSLGFPVVDALCHATIPRPRSDDRVGSRITPSVFVLLTCKHAENLLLIFRN